jgi:hypothetical protein
MSKDSWQSMPQLNEARNWAGACLLKDTIYVVGGLTTRIADHSSYLKSIERLSLATSPLVGQTWELVKLSCREFTPRYFPSVVVLNLREILILGGKGQIEAKLSDVFCLDTSTGKSTLKRVTAGTSSL